MKTCTMNWDNLKKADNHKNEDSLKYEDNVKNEDDFTCQSLSRKQKLANQPNLTQSFQIKLSESKNTEIELKKYIQSQKM